jgi:hypothetical protein
MKENKEITYPCLMQADTCPNLICLQLSQNEKIFLRSNEWGKDLTTLSNED